MKVGHNVKKLSSVGAVLVLPAIIGWMAFTPLEAGARSRAVPAEVLEAWPGERIVLLLPVQLGPGWNVDPNFGTALLPSAEQNLQRVLQATGKFSVIKPHRFNPILQRAFQERRITKEQLENLVTKPTLENARIVMSKIDPSFDQPSLITQFSLEEVRVSGTAKDTRVQTQVSGRLYEVGGAVASQSIVVTSNSVGGGGRTSSKVVAAATDAFNTVAAQFVKPIEELNLTAPEAPATAVPATPATEPAVVPTSPVDGTPVATWPPATPTEPATGPATPADASRGRDVVPQLPAPQPPLGINVPNAPTVER